MPRDLSWPASSWEGCWLLWAELHRLGRALLPSMPCMLLTVGIMNILLIPVHFFLPTPLWIGRHWQFICSLVKESLFLLWTRLSSCTMAPPISVRSPPGPDLLPQCALPCWEWYWMCLHKRAQGSQLPLAGNAWGGSVVKPWLLVLGISQRKCPLHMSKNGRLPRWRHLASSPHTILGLVPESGPLHQQRPHLPA